MLGVFRAEEDNRVAAGERGIRLQPARPGGASFEQALRAIDATQLRRDLHASMLSDVLAQAEAFLGSGRESLAELRRYTAGVRTAQNHGLQLALRHFPMDRVMRRFAKIWARTDPPAVKFMRRTGSLIELPLKALVGAAGWAREKLSGEPPPEKPSQQFARKLEENLVTAATDLHQQVLSPHIAPAAAAEAGACGPVRSGKCAPRGAAGPAAAAAKRLQRHPAGRPRPPGGDRRYRRGHGDGTAVGWPIISAAGWGCGTRSAQTFWAFLNVLPAAAAVTYVLSTGRPRRRRHHQGQAGRAFRSEGSLRPGGHSGHPRAEAGGPETAPGHARAGRPNLVEPQIRKSPGALRAGDHGRHSAHGGTGDR